jgi:MoaA/NifB/PqqE/SkfB family radical SAM enzyme
MKIKTGIRVQVDGHGNLILPHEIAERYGLKAGSELVVSEDATGFSLRLPLTHLSKVYVEPTAYCNLECRTCIRHSWKEPLGMMTAETFDRIIEGIRSVAPVPEIFFGGFGEPLSHPGIVDMVSRAKAVGAHVELITNGTLLTPVMSQALIDAGLDMIWVSLDGARPESYADVRLGAALPKIIDNLSGFMELRDHPQYSVLYPNPLARPRIGIVFVAMKRNIDDLPAVIRLGRSLGATRFMVTNVLPYTSEMCDETLYQDALGELTFQPSPYVTEIPKFDIMKATQPFLRAFYGGNSISFAGADLSGTTDRCPFIDKRAMAVCWDGGVTPCLALLHDHDSFLNGRERHSRRYHAGNLAERSLIDLWNDPAHVTFRKTVDSFDFSPCSYCGGCELSEKNEEDCFANNFPTCGGCLWAQGVVQCP